MCLVFENEMLHRRKYLTERIENLGHGRYLPVEVPAVDTCGKDIRLGLLAGIETHVNVFTGEPETSTVGLEVLCCVHKLQEPWNGKRELLEERNEDLLEARGGDSTNNCFQVSTNSLERKVTKVRKGDVCRDWRIYELPLHVSVGNSECGGDHEHLQLRHG
ncbi:hypothetical protein DFH94DRAFT_773868 [Russula ochroleuca]|uniref:Uncharacterized protein n=1 Tax=Russula ochroleuca TaxID=152965 RepID=A0A9P5JXU0_9AGAM|nr:hypothetical protein DFH94DRAFT_773868 [Russula ochroleuca]